MNHLSTAPEISVIVPVHDVGVWVGQTLDSILGQSDVSMEVLVIDDASTDDTYEVVREIAERDSRVRLLSATGAGGAQARDLGVELASGEYIVFADGDDLVPDGAYAAMLKSARASGSDMVIGRYFKFYPTRTWHPTTRWPAFDESRQRITLTGHPSLINNRACWNRLFKREWWLAEAITFPTVPRSNDIVPMTKALTRAKSIDVVRDQVYLYRDRPGSTSMTAKSVRGEGFESYLSQEVECRSLVVATGSLDLIDEYDTLLLDKDGWVHLSKFLRNEEWRVVAPGALERIRAWIAQIVSVTSSRNLPRGRAEIGWAWLLSGEGCWEDATRIAKALAAPVDRRSWPSPEVWVEQAKAFGTGNEGRERLARRNLIAHLLEPIATRAVSPSADRAAALVAEQAYIAEVFKEIEPGEMTAAQHQVLLMLLQGETGRRAPTVSRPSVRAIAFGDSGVRIVVESPRPDLIVGLRLLGQESHRELAISHDDDSVVATVAPGLLADEEWSLVCAIQTPFGIVEQQLGIRPEDVVTRLSERVLTATPDRRLRIRDVARASGTPGRDELDAAQVTARATRVEVQDDELRISLTPASEARVVGARLWNEAPGRAGTRDVAVRRSGDTIVVARSANDLPDREWILLATFETAVGRIEVPVRIGADAIVKPGPKYRLRSIGQMGFRVTPPRGLPGGTAGGAVGAHGGRRQRWKARLKRYMPAPVWAAAKTVLKR